MARAVCFRLVGMTKTGAMYDSAINTISSGLNTQITMQSGISPAGAVRLVHALGRASLISFKV